MESQSPTDRPALTRRGFLRHSLRGVAGLACFSGGTVAYGCWEASQIHVSRVNVPVRNLPEAFAGTTIAVLADLHHGPYVGLQFIQEAVRLASTLRPDVFALVGDFGHNGNRAIEQLPPCLDALSTLEAPLGVFAVPGNHDMARRGKVYRDVICSTSITDLTNRSIRLSRDNQSLWLAGVDDLWFGRPDQDLALVDVTQQDACILLSHNPDFAEESPDPRVSLMLSGHTHGGQVYVPVLGSPWTPTRYGDKYRHGLVQGPASPVFITRGLGESGIPLRIGSPPEINLLTLVPANRP